MYRDPCIESIYPTLLGFGGIQDIILSTVILNLSSSPALVKEVEAALALAAPSEGAWSPPETRTTSGASTKVISLRMEFVIFVLRPRNSSENMKSMGEEGDLQNRRGCS